MTATLSLSIIIPALNEAAHLPRLLAQLAPLRADGAQVIVADGGSSDGSPQLLTELAQWLSAPRGRARQMNAGAAIASGEVLWFVHADSQLPANADRLIAAALADGQHLWGRFDVLISGQPWMLKVVARMINWRSRLSGIATGDQGIFVLRSTFESLGGFAELPLMEDVQLCTQLRRISKPACIRQRLTTSGRRWETRGVWRTILLMWRLRWAYWRGVPIEQIAEAYR
ncbi:MAG: TIGR04283 family arsenosugar biosynthesis glycosyltransferase [Pseudomonadaceae bacterium]|jgi:rSAM/selenodomain-associated transferase 2|nr:TIGR04283 family arsenosugar biosynthesis glycosyltransferase [Pseudomonadaceae bacterium]